MQNREFRDSSYQRPVKKRLRLDTSLAFQGHLLNREGATCYQGVFEVKTFIIRCIRSSC